MSADLPTKPAKPKPFRAWDSAVIANPIMVVRIGYPLCTEDGLKEVRQPDGPFVYAVNQLYARCAGRIVLDDKFRADIDHALAKAWVRTKGFGGPVRTLHTRTVEALRGERCRIMSVRTVRTGRRVPGYTDHFSGDSDAPYLADVKVHRLAMIDRFDEHNKPYEIEVTNLEHLAPDHGLA